MKTEIINGLKVKRSGERKAKLSAMTVILLTVFIVYCVIMFILLAWMLLSSVKDPTYFVKKTHNTYCWPNDDCGWSFSNYPNLIDAIPKICKGITGIETDFLGVFVTSILYGLGCAFFQTLVPCLTAYVCARYKYKFSQVVYATAIIVMTIPVVGSLPSEVSLAIDLGFYDHVWGLWLMKANFLGMYFLVFYEMFNSLSPTYFEAASIDGANDMQKLTNIGFPLAKNTFMTVLLINFITYWNDYQIPLLYLPNHVTIATLMFKITQINRVEGLQDFMISAMPNRLAGTVIMVIPTVILFLCFHKKLLGNLTIGGIKG